MPTAAAAKLRAAILRLRHAYSRHRRATSHHSSSAPRLQPPSPQKRSPRRHRRATSPSSSTTTTTVRRLPPPSVPFLYLFDRCLLECLGWNVLLLVLCELPLWNLSAGVGMLLDASSLSVMCSTNCLLMRLTMSQKEESYASMSLSALPRAAMPLMLHRDKIGRVEKADTRNSPPSFPDATSCP